MSDKPTTAELVKFVRSLNSAITTKDGWVAPGSVARGLTLGLVADRLEAAAATITALESAIDGRDDLINDLRESGCLDQWNDDKVRKYYEDQQEQE